MSTPVARFELHPEGPYSLAASIRFLEGFAPAAYERDPASVVLRLAFVVDGTDDVAGVEVRQRGDTVVGDVYGEAAPGLVQRQVARVLSLDVDGSGFPAVGLRDPVVGRLQARYPGLRPVLFWSPYEAAAWALIGQRIRITQAARIKANITEAHGEAVEIAGERVHAFPAPGVLARLESFPGLNDVKIARLQALGRAATGGALDADMLRSLPVPEALARLEELPGIGEFSSQLVLLRGAGTPDVVPTAEPRLMRAFALAYGREATPEEIAAQAEAWRPYRTWVVLLLRTMLEDNTHEISGPRRR